MRIEMHQVNMIVICYEWCLS